MSTVASAGVAAWVVPEIFTAKPAAGAALSGPVTSPGSPPVSSGTTGGGMSPAAPSQPPGPTSGVSTAPAKSPAAPSGVTTAADTLPPGPLAQSGVNIERDAQIGAALIAGGWAMHHWASRKQEERPPA